jgi:hypothetical protein
METQKDVLKQINRGILKAAKKGEFCYYWDVTKLDRFMVGDIVVLLEKEGKTVKSKGENFKIIYW